MGIAFGGSECVNAGGGQTRGSEQDMVADMIRHERKREVLE